MTVTIKTQDNEREFESKNDDFADMKELLDQQNVEYEIENGDGDTTVGTVQPAGEMEDGAVPPEMASEGSKSVGVVEEQGPPEKPVNVSEDTPETVDLDDPIQFLKDGNEELTATIKGTTVIKKKGFRLIQHHFGISTDSEVVVGPEETDQEFCRVKARAEKPDGQYAEAHASASTNRGDDSYLLVSMADTRAKSRALSDVTGSGALAMEETHGTELEK